MLARLPVVGVYFLGIVFTVVSALFNYTLGSWIGTSTVLGLSVLGLAYGSLDIALAYLVYMVRRVPVVAGIFVGLWCMYLCALSCWSIMSYSFAGDARLKSEYKRIADLELEIKNDTTLFNTWTDKLGQTHNNTTSWEKKQRRVGERLHQKKSELAHLRSEHPPLPLVIFTEFGVRGSESWIRAAFGIGFTVTGLMLFLVVPTCSKPRKRKGSEQTKPKKRESPTPRGTGTRSTPDMSNVVQLIRNREVDPTIRGVRGKVGSTEKAQKLMKEIGPKLVKEGVLIEKGRGYAYA